MGSSVQQAIDPANASAQRFHTHIPHQVIVIGGGLAGLIAALHLAERGVQPLLLEAAPRLGGRVAGGNTVTLQHQGRQWSFTAEHGIHGLWGQYRNLRATLARHAIASDLVPAQREDWIHGENGRVYRAEAGSMVRRSPVPAPFHYLGLLVRPGFLRMLTLRDLIGLPRVVGSLYLALAYDPLLEPVPLEGRSLEGLFAQWPPRLRAFIAALMRSGLAAHPEEVPLSGTLAFLRFYTLLRRDAWAFDYFPNDSGTSLIEPLAEAIKQRGGQIRTSTMVGELQRSNNGWLVHYQEADQSAVLAAQQVIIACDGPAARALLCRSTETAELAQELEWPQGLATGIVRLWYEIAPEGAESGICSGDMVIDNFFWLHRFQRDAGEWHRATGGGVVEAHIYGPAEILALPDAALLARAVADMQRAYPELRGKLIHSTLQRNSASHTRFGIGASQRYPAVESPWPALSCCGDWLRYPHPALFLERATVTGIAAANRALAALGCPEHPILPAYPAEGPAQAIERGLRWVRGMTQRRNKRV
jgi:carotenoid phi-ring synthase / carotenoid chi-ring synthase